MVVWVAWLQLGNSRLGLSWLQQEARWDCVCRLAASHAWASGGLAGLLCPSHGIHGLLLPLSLPSLYLTAALPSRLVKGFLALHAGPDAGRTRAEGAQGHQPGGCSGHRVFMTRLTGQLPDSTHDQRLLSGTPGFNKVKLDSTIGQLLLKY